MAESTQRHDEQQQEQGNLKKNTRIMIAVPCVDYIHWKFAECLAHLTEWMTANGYHFDLKMIGGSLIYLARDQIARDALAFDYTH